MVDRFKSKVAREAFLELCKIAGLERDRLDGEVSSNKLHSEYERVLLKVNIAQVYQSMLAEAYKTAMDVEVKAMIQSAQVSSIFGARE